MAKFFPSSAIAFLSLALCGAASQPEDVEEMDLDCASGGFGLPAREWFKITKAANGEFDVVGQTTTLGKVSAFPPGRATAERVAALASAVSDVRNVDALSAGF